MKSGGSFSQKDWTRGNKYEDDIVKKIVDLGVKAEKTNYGDSYQNAKYGDVNIFYGENYLKAEVKSSMWVPYRESKITEVDLFIFNSKFGDFVCTDVSFIKNKLKDKAKSFDLETSRGTKMDSSHKDFRIKDPKQPKKQLADLGYRFNLRDFPGNSLFKLDKYLENSIFRNYNQ